MRPIEIILVILNLLFLLYILSGKRHKLFYVFTLSSVIAFTSHAIIEGLRWQMLFSYIVALGTFPALLYRSFRNKNTGASKRLKVAAASICIFLLLVTSLLSYIMPVFQLPEPTGKYPVGFTSRYYTDESRDETFTDDTGDRRELMVRIWYPCKDNKSPRGSYLRDKDLLINTASKEQGIPGFVFAYLKLVKSHHHADAPVSDIQKSYPLIVFSHGMGTLPYLYSGLLEELASHGYIVAAIEHTYFTLSTVFPDERVTTMRTDTERYSVDQSSHLARIWSEDIRFVIDQMQLHNCGSSTNTQVENSTDFSTIGVIGHSFGGAAAYSACFSDRWIKAGIDMDGTLYRVDNGIKDKAFMLMTSSSYARSVKTDLHNYCQLTKAEQEDLASKGISSRQFDSMVKTAGQSRRIFKDVTDNGGYFISIQGTEHYSFSDLPFISPLPRLVGLTGKIGASRGAEIVNAYTLSFFGKYLKGESSKLLNGISGGYPEVIFENIED